MVLGNVVAITVEDGVLVEGHPEFSLLEPLARLGKDEWGLPGEVVALRRPRTPDDIA
jgi:hypothetical protein